MDGILLFKKPILWTSHDAVDFIRRRAGQRSVGHAGTLDPLATGLLIVLLGKATKLSGEFSGFDKDYKGAMTLGVVTDTQDMDGRILSQNSAETVREEDVRRVFLEMTGDQQQLPPAYSAVKKNGKKLYEWARAGVIAEVAPRTIRIDRFEMLRFFLPEVAFFLTCSKGAYVRSACDLAGRKLGCGATLSALVRTRVGPFRIEKALDESTVRKMSPMDFESSLLKNENIQRF